MDVSYLNIGHHTPCQQYLLCKETLISVYFSVFLTIKPTRCTNFSNFILEMKLYMFWTVSLSIIRSYSLYIQQWYMSYGFVDSFRAAAAAAGSGWNCSSAVPS
jgi:hypothetical protein